MYMTSATYCHTTCPLNLARAHATVGRGLGADLDDTLVLTSECDKVAFAAVRTFLTRPNARSGLTTRETVPPCPNDDIRVVLHQGMREDSWMSVQHTSRIGQCTDVTVVVGLRCLTGRRAGLQVCALAKQRQPTVDDEAMLAAFKKRFKSDPWDTTHAVEVTQWRAGHWAAALQEQGIDDAVNPRRVLLVPSPRLLRWSFFHSPLTAPRAASPARIQVGFRVGACVVPGLAPPRRRVAHMDNDGVQSRRQDLAAALQKCFDDTRLGDFPFIAGTQQMVDALTAAGIAIVIITNGHHFVRPLRSPSAPLNRGPSLHLKRATAMRSKSRISGRAGVG
jgi:hypothetical protein